MNRTRATHSPSTPPRQPGQPGTLTVILQIDEGDPRPIAFAAPPTVAPRAVHLTVRPTIGEPRNSPDAWMATLTFGGATAAFSANAYGAGRFETWAVEALFCAVHDLHETSVISLAEANEGRAAINVRLAALEAIHDPLRAEYLCHLAVSLADGVDAAEAALMTQEPGGDE